VYKKLVTARAAQRINFFFGDGEGSNSTQVNWLVMKMKDGPSSERSGHGENFKSSEDVTIDISTVAQWCRDQYNKNASGATRLI
jgi:hypothetical protein